MNPLARMSMRHKLTCTTMLVAMAAVLVMCGATTVFDYGSIRREVVEQLTTHADLIAGNSAAALTFGDAAAARDILASLRASETIEAAAIYTADGRALAVYLPHASAPLPHAASLKAGLVQFSDRWVELARPVVMNGQRLGTVFVRSNLSELNERIHSYIWIMVMALGAAFALAYGLALALQRVVTRPILHLTATAKMISVQKDYTQRAVKYGHDELGVLTDCFNEMLEQIQNRDAQLQGHRAHLEEQVTLRTEELQSANAELAKALDRAESANRAKSAFLANMSHEIRTPMTAIVGYADMMLEPDQTLSDRLDNLQVIRRNARHLLELINDILDLSKIEADKMSVERIPTDLPQLVLDVVSLMRPRAMEKGLDFELKFDGPLPRQIKTDPLRLRQILMNTIANAVKFTVRGHVELRISCQRDRCGQTVVRFDVQDTGIGMSRQQVERLFRPFNQADDSMTRRFGGTGLGLAISQRLAVLLGGEISATSELGAGSTFTLRLDAGQVDDEQMMHHVQESLRAQQTEPEPARHLALRGRILLAEDGPDNQRLISTQLRRAGAEVAIAENGLAAVSLVTSGREFDLILMDMQMPELDGYAATGELRQRGLKIPIIALTAHAMADDRAKCLQAGCTDYLSKPVDRDVLLATVGYYLQQWGVGHSAATTTVDDDSVGNAAGEPGAAEPEPAENSAPPVAATSPQAVPREDPATPTPPREMVPASAATIAATVQPQSTIRSRFADDPDMNEILGEFLASLPQKVQQFQLLLDQQNLDDLRRALHQLKGAGGGYGFDALSDVAARAEQAVKRADPLTTIGAQVQDLIDLIRRVEGYDRVQETRHGSESAGH